MAAHAVGADQHQRADAVLAGARRMASGSAAGAGVAPWRCRRRLGFRGEGAAQARRPGGAGGVGQHGAAHRRSARRTVRRRTGRRCRAFPPSGRRDRRGRRRWRRRSQWRGCPLRPLSLRAGRPAAVRQIWNVGDARPVGLRWRNISSVASLLRSVPHQRKRLRSCLARALFKGRTGLSLSAFTMVRPSAAGLSATWMPAAAHRLELRGRGVLAAGDDGAGMAHAAAGGAVAPAMKPTTGFFDRCSRAEELGGLDLRWPPISPIMTIDFGLGVGEEQFQHLDEVGALDRVAADADAGGLAEARPPWSAPPPRRSGCRSGRRCRPSRGGGYGPA